MWVKLEEMIVLQQKKLKEGDMEDSEEDDQLEVHNVEIQEGVMMDDIADNELIIGLQNNKRSFDQVDSSDSEDDDLVNTDELSKYKYGSS